MNDGLPEGTLTVVFTRIDGPTDVVTSHGTGPGEKLLQDHEEIVGASRLRHGGQEVRNTADGSLLLFGSARRAVLCALDIQRALNLRNLSQLGPELTVRIGMNSGEVGQERGDIFGAAVNAAARIADKARGGQILVAEVVKQLTGMLPEGDFVSRGRTALKGFPERWHLYEVVPKKPLEARPEAPQLVGRERERAELTRLLDQAFSGRGQLVLVSGEPGVGKTRITADLAQVAAGRGAMVLSGRCPEMEGAPPFAAFAQLFEEGAEDTQRRANLRRALADDADQVARIAPGLRRLYTDLSEPPTLAAEQERYQLFSAVSRTLLRAADSQPLTVIMDDLQNADEPTLLLLEHVAQRMSNAPLLIIATHRDLERERGTPLQGSIERLLRGRLAARIHLQPLDEAGVGQLLTNLAGRVPPPELVAEIYRDTDGNPFFVEEVFKHLAEEGRLLNEKGEFLPSGGIGELDVPGSVRLVVGRRLQRLSEDCRRVLSIASVMGRSFQYRLLESVADVDGDRLLDALDEAEAVAMLSSATEGTAVRFTFDHELTRQTLLSEMSVARRQRVHLRLAESLEQQYGADGGDHAAEVAHHLIQAGDLVEPKDAARALIQAGRAALRALAFEEALTYFDRVSMDLLPPAIRADVLRLRGLAMRSLGFWDEAIGLWEECLQLYEAAGDRVSAARMCRMMANQVSWAMRYPEALAIAERGVRLIGDEPSLERSRLLSVVAGSLSQLGEHDRATAVVDEAMKLADQLNDLRARGYAANARALHHLSYAQYADGLEVSLTAAEQLRRAGDERGRAQLLGFAQIARFYLARFDEAEQMAEELVPLLRRIGNVGQVLWSNRVQAAISFGRDPDVKAYETFAREDLETCHATGTRLIADSHSFLGVTHFWAGDWDLALASVEAGARAQADSTLTGNSIQVALVAAYLGDRARVLDLIEGERARFPVEDHAVSRRSWTLLMGAIEALFVVGERDQAAELYPWIVSALESGLRFRFYDFRLLEMLAGMAAYAGGHWSTAENHLMRAIEEAERLPLRLEKAEAMRVYGSLLKERGEELQARPFLDQARAVYEEIGMPRHVELCG